MATLISILALIGILVVLVLIHEVGHFVTARMAGVQVLEFGFGYPPRLFAVRRGETEYSFNALPLGGFVKLVGEEDPTHPRSLAGRPAWVRAIVLSSGALMNALLPILFFSITAAVPQPGVVGDVRVLAVAPGSPADQAGVRLGDAVLEINGERVARSMELSYIIQLNLGAPVEFLVRREGQTQVISGMVPRFSPPAGQGPTGIVVRTGDVQVDSVAPGSPAAQAGLRAGDLVIQVDGRPFTAPRDLAVRLEELRRENSRRPVELLLERDGRLQTVPVPVPAGDTPLRPEAPSAGSGQALGATFSMARLQETMLAKPVWEAVPYGVRRSLETLVLAKNTIITSFTGASPLQLTGPVGIAQMAGEVASFGGLLGLLELAALLSMNMAFFNILPFPMLDGGRLLFVAIEVVRRGKRISPQREGLVHLVGFAVLLTLIVVVTYFDVVRIVRGESLLR